MKRIAASILFFLAAVTAAAAQGSPGLIFGQVPTAAQWNSYFAAKQNYLGANPCIITGCVMQGEIITVAPTAATAGFNLPHGTAPTNPVNGDLWTTSGGLYVQINGATIGPLTEDTSASFAATQPLVVTFPSGVVTYAFNLAHSNIFTAAQEINLNSGSLPAAQTGTIFQVGNANSVVSRIESDSFAAATHFSGLRSEGTAASPTACATGSEIASLNGGGYNGSAWVIAKAGFRTYCNPSGSTWTTGDEGTYADVFVTPTGSTTGVEVAKFSATSTGAVFETIGTVGGSSGGLVLANAFAVTILASSSGTQAWNLTLPTAYPVGNGYALTSSTVGVASWTSVATSNLSNVTLSGDCTNVSAAVTCLDVNGVPFTSYATASVGQLPGVTTNAAATAGNIGQIISSIGEGGSGTVTISNASPAIITDAATCTASQQTACVGIGSAVNFTTTGGLPTGLTVGTNYYVISTGFTAGTSYEVSATPGGSAINTSSSGSGTQTRVGGVITSSSSAFTVASATLSAGDWNCWGNTENNTTGTTTLAEGFIGTTANSTSGRIPESIFVQDYGTGLLLGITQYGMSGPVPLLLSGSTTYYLNVLQFFSTGAGTAAGSLICRRAR